VDARLRVKVAEDPRKNAMKKQSRKLNLNRETLAPMQSDDLANVNGGMSQPCPYAGCPTGPSPWTSTAEPTLPKPTFPTLAVVCKTF
jgi:hypothetical protein